MSWSADGSKIVSGSSILIKRCASGRRRQVVYCARCQGRGIRALVPGVCRGRQDGSKIVSGSYDRHGAHLGGVVRSFTAHAVEGIRIDVSSVSWSADGSKIVSGS